MNYPLVSVNNVVLIPLAICSCLPSTNNAKAEVTLDMCRLKVKCIDHYVALTYVISHIPELPPSLFISLLKKIFLIGKCDSYGVFPQANTIM